MVGAFAHGAMGRRIDPSWGGARRSSVVGSFAHDAMVFVGSILHGGPNELFIVPASAPRLV